MTRMIDLRPDAAAARSVLLDGLYASPPRVPPRYFYDELGCALFSAITRLPEYYPARLEREIFNDHVGAIAEVLPTQAMLIDLGAGDGAKSRWLMSRLAPAHYVAVDIAGECTQRALGSMVSARPDVPVTILACDFDEGLHWPDGLRCERPLFFYPGSSIGNFSPPQAKTFLRSLRQLCDASADRSGDLLVSVDLVKDSKLMLAAYDDALGVTAAFNRNLLRHLNRLIGANFVVEHFHHQVIFNAKESRIEMWLLPDTDQQVRWCDGGRVLHSGEGILTEYSHKYTVDRFRALLADAGFDLRHQWLDASAGYLVCHARSC